VYFLAFQPELYLKPSDASTFTIFTCYQNRQCNLKSYHINPNTFSCREQLTVHSLKASCCITILYRPAMYLNRTWTKKFRSLHLNLDFIAIKNYLEALLTRTKRPFILYTIPFAHLLHIISITKTDRNHLET
jgi:hypothetical protein